MTWPTGWTAEARAKWLRGAAMGVPLVLMAAWITDGYWWHWSSSSPDVPAVAEPLAKAGIVASHAAAVNPAVVVDMAAVGANSTKSRASARSRKPLSLDIVGAMVEGSNQLVDMDLAKATEVVIPTSGEGVALDGQASVASPGGAVPEANPSHVPTLIQAADARVSDTSLGAAFAEPSQAVKPGARNTGLPFPFSMLTAACALPAELGKVFTQIR